jgi:hypothetical protein
MTEIAIGKSLICRVHIKPVLLCCRYGVTGVGSGFLLSSFPPSGPSYSLSAGDCMNRLCTPLGERLLEMRVVGITRQLSLLSTACLHWALTVSQGDAKFSCQRTAEKIRRFGVMIRAEATR